MMVRNKGCCSISVYLDAYELVVMLVDNNAAATATRCGRVFANKSTIHIFSSYPLIDAYAALSVAVITS